MESATTHLQLHTLDGRAATLIGTAETLTPKARARRAAKVTGIFWGIATFTILLPALHFVLPPLFFGGGLYFGVKVWRQAEVVRNAQGPCPACGQPLRFALLVKQERLKDLCPRCRHSFKIHFGGTPA